MVANFVYLISLVAQQIPPGVDFEDPPNLLEDAELKPSAFYFLDEDGNPSIWPGMSFEEIDRLKSVGGGWDEPGRDFDIVSCTLEGSVEGQRAELTVSTQIAFHDVNERWVSIPLGLQGLHQSAPVSVEGIEQWRWAVNKTHGYVFWAYVEEQDSCQLTIPMSTAVHNSTGESWISSQLPETNVEVEITVPGENLQAWVQEDPFAMAEVKGVSSGNGGSRLQFRSTGGQQSFSWKAAELETKPAQVLTARGVWDIKWPESDQNAQAEVALTVENLRGPLEPFRITIPTAAPDSITLRSETFDSNESVQISTASDQQRTELTIVPDRSAGSRSQLTLRLFIDIPVQTNQNPTVLRMPEIVVEKAVRQRGEFVVEVSDDARLRWTESESARIQRATADAAVDPGTYRFVYSRVPIEMEMWQEDAQEQVRLSPTYRVTVGPQRFDLQGQINGSAIAKSGQPLEIELGDWKLEELTSGGAKVATEHFKIENGVLTIEPNIASRFSTTETGSFDLAIQFDCSQPNAGNEGEISFALPRILWNQAGRGLTPLVEPAVVSVTAALGYKLTIDIEKTVGLNRIVEETAEDAIRFQEQAVDASRISAVLTAEQPTVLVRMQTECRLQKGMLSFEQSSQFTVVGQPLLSIPIQIPTAIVPESLRITVNNQPQRSLGSGGEEAPPGYRRILLDRSLTGGAHVLTVSGEIPLTAFELAQGENATASSGSESRSLGRSLQIELPVPFPESENATREIIFDTENLSVAGWTLQPSAAGGIGGEVNETDPVVSVSGEEARLSRRVETGTSASYSVERVLFRTVVGAPMVYDEALLRVSGRGDLILTLPASIGVADFEVTVDGEQVPFDTNGSGSYRVPLPQGADQIVRLAVWRSDDTQPYRITFPWKELAADAKESYWQVTLPSDELAVAHSSGSRSAWSWKWDRWCLVRIPSLSDEELAEWLGSEISGLSDGNVYLLKPGIVSTAWVFHWSVAEIWMLSAVATLCLAALILYVRFLRTTVMLFLLLVTIMTGAFAVPDAALLISQYLVLSLVLLLLVAALRQLIVRPNPKSVFGKRPVLRAGSTRTVVRGMGSERDREIDTTLPQPAGGPPA